jgi:superfamily I DNA/RNA helicase
MHSSKGLDADFIFIPFMEDSLSLPAKDIEEMRRLLYVALTRAKVGVIFSWAWNRSSQSRFNCSGKGGNTIERLPSKFIRDCGINPSWKNKESVDEALKLLAQISKTITDKDKE